MNEEQKSVSIMTAAKIMGKSPQFVRIGLQRGILPFGIAIKMSSVWTYYINPIKFENYINGNINN